MARFLNKKEDVIDFKLTSYGHHLLGKGTGLSLSIMLFLTIT